MHQVAGDGGVGAVRDEAGAGGVRVPVQERAVELQRQQGQQAHPADHRQG